MTVGTIEILNSPFMMANLHSHYAYYGQILQ